MKRISIWKFPQGKKKCYSGREKAGQPDFPETAGHNQKKAKCSLFFFPLFDIVHLTGISWYSISSSNSHTSTRTTKSCYPPLSSYRSENLVPKHSCVANLCTEIYHQPKHMKEKEAILHREESTSSSLPIQCCTVCLSNMLKKSKTLASTHRFSSG